jgi:hypothetical protein
VFAFAVTVPAEVLTGKLATNTLLLAIGLAIAIFIVHGCFGVLVFVFILGQQREWQFSVASVQFSVVCFLQIEQWHRKV